MSNMERFNKPVPLSNNWSGHYLTDVEKVAITAITLGTVNVEPISDLTGLKKFKIRTLLGILEGADWDMRVALEHVNDDRQGNLIANREAYPILNMKGGVECA